MHLEVGSSVFFMQMFWKTGSGLVSAVFVPQAPGRLVEIWSVKLEVWQVQFSSHNELGRLVDVIQVQFALLIGLGICRRFGK